MVLAVVLASGYAGGGRAVAQPAATALTVEEVVGQAVAEHPELMALRAEVDAAAGLVAVRQDDVHQLKETRESAS